MTEVTITLKMVQLNCGICGIAHSIPFSKYSKCEQDGESWTCPNGHNLVFTEYEAKKLRREVERLEKDKIRAEETRKYWVGEYTRLERTNRALRGHLTRAKKILKHTRHGKRQTL